MNNKEKVVELGVEGGGAAIYRTPFGSDSWQFHIKGNSICLDDNDDEDWQFWQSKPVPTLEEALRAVSDEWVIFYPLMVHPDYHTEVWELALAAVSMLPEQLKGNWQHSGENWQRICQQQEE